MKRIDVYLLPTLVEAEELAGKSVVVVDVLRATTTIIHALAAGAAHVVPCLEIDEAKAVARQLGQSARLGGERGGRPIPGFDLGNSPSEYSRDAVGGKTVVFTTTNGTKALLRCKSASHVLIGAFVNFSAICREVETAGEFAILCAGTDGQVTREDVLFAGAVVDDLARRGQLVLNDQALLAADAWRTAVRILVDRPLGVTLRESRGGRNLIEIGHERDIDLAAQIDKFDIVPYLDLATWRIRL